MLFCPHVHVLLLRKWSINSIIESANNEKGIQNVDHGFLKSQFFIISLTYKMKYIVSCEGKWFRKTDNCLKKEIRYKNGSTVVKIVKRRTLLT